MALASHAIKIEASISKDKQQCMKQGEVQMLFGAENNWPGDTTERNWVQVEMMQHDDAVFEGIKVCFNHAPPVGGGDPEIRIKGMKALLAWETTEDGEVVRSEYQRFIGTQSNCLVLNVGADERVAGMSWDAEWSYFGILVR